MSLQLRAEKASTLSMTPGSTRVRVIVNTCLPACIVFQWQPFSFNMSCIQRSEHLYTAAYRETRTTAVYNVKSQTDHH